MKSADASWMYDRDVVTVALVWGFHVFRKSTVQMKDLQPIVQISLNADLSSCGAKVLAWGRLAKRSSRPFERHAELAHFCILRMAMWAAANDACRFPMSVSQIASLIQCALHAACAALFQCAFGIQFCSHIYEQTTSVLHNALIHFKACTQQEKSPMGGFLKTHQLAKLQSSNTIVPLPSESFSLAYIWMNASGVLVLFLFHAQWTWLFSMAVCGDRRRLQLDNGPWGLRMLHMQLWRYAIHASLDSDRTQCKKEKDLNCFTVILQSITAPRNEIWVRFPWLTPDHLFLQTLNMILLLIMKDSDIFSSAWHSESRKYKCNGNILQFFRISFAESTRIYGSPIKTKK